MKRCWSWLPTWSSDGRRLLYVHVNRDKPSEIGLYTMTPDGNDRRMVGARQLQHFGLATTRPRLLAIRPLSTRCGRSRKSVIGKAQEVGDL